MENAPSNVFKAVADVPIDNVFPPTIYVLIAQMPLLIVNPFLITPSPLVNNCP